MLDCTMQRDWGIRGNLSEIFGTFLFTIEIDKLDIFYSNEIDTYVPKQLKMFPLFAKVN